MKMVRSLLLGTAAGLVAAAGAQAADLPVKAKPVQYVKICDLYGAGFYYMPGTDICLKVGGFVRAQYYSGHGSGGTTGAYFGGNGVAQYTRQNGAGQQPFLIRNRAVATFDTRQATDYGTLRAYLLLGFTHENTTYGAPSIYFTRAFVQLAGFTVGKAVSFFDFFSAAAHGYLSFHGTSDTGDGGWNVLAYTWQFGNGVSLTLSAEEPRRQSILNAGATGTVFAVSGATGVLNSNPNNQLAPFGNAITDTNYGEVRAPDGVVALRISQAWGSWQVMGAVHDVISGFYASPTGSTTGNLIFGNPSDKIGWAIGTGVRVNITPNDQFQIEGTYSEGAVRYVTTTENAGRTSSALFSGPTSLGWGPLVDAVYGPNGSSLQLTKAWGVAASFEHKWNANWRTSIYGMYNSFDYNPAATAFIAAHTCGAAPGAVAPAVAATRAAGSITAISNCNPDWKQWFLGSRTQWNLNPGFYIGVDVLYSKLETAFQGTGFYQAVGGTPRPSGTYNIRDVDNVSVSVRVHRDFLP
ncbi:MAG: porin [Proteobacteria bacterium]|nr:porin [Pseudomonadota bacterium]